jgi:hypothetical protein
MLNICSVLSKITSDGRRDGQRLLALHNTSTPLEYARIVLGHPSNELNIMKDDRILGGLTVTRGVVFLSLPPDLRYYWLSLEPFFFQLSATFLLNSGRAFPSAFLQNYLQHGETASTTV